MMGSDCLAAKYSERGVLQKRKEKEKVMSLFGSS
jgi:hypothetical protein